MGVQRMQGGFTKEKFLQIKEMAADLAQGENRRFTCPFCEAEHERSLSVTRIPAGWVFNCFRGSCKRSGLVGDSYGVPVNSPPKEKEYKQYDGHLSNLPTYLWHTAISKYGISFPTIREQGFKYATDEHRLYLPIFNYNGFQIGEMLKAVSQKDIPKSITYPWSKYPLLHFPLKQCFSDTIILTEDIYSSIRTSEIGFSAALLGTNLTEEMFKLLKRIQIKKIVLLLDGDEAGIKASTRIYNKYNPFIPVHIKTLPQDHDPKDLSPFELSCIIKE